MDNINKPTTVTEIAAILGKTERTIQIMANKSGWRFALETSSGKKRLYALTELPKDIREKINISRLNATLRLDDTTKVIIAGNNAQPDVSVVAEKAALAKSTLDDKQRERDGSRRLILQFIKGFKGGLRKAVRALNSGYTSGTLHPDLMHAIRHCNDKANDARVGTLSVRSVTRWKSDAKNNGHCIPKKTRIATRWNDVWWLPLLLACYRKPQKPHLSEAYAEFEKDWHAQGLQKKLPSYSTARRRLNSVPVVVLEMGRSTGSDMAALRAFVRRDWSGMSNEVWVGDGHTFKAKVRHPEHGYAFAPEVTLIIDAASRFIVGWAFSLSENQIAVSEALGKGMQKHGKPLIYYSDNGAGQTAKTIDCPVGGMLARLGVHHETGIPGNPQGRGLIEGLWDITTIWVAKQMPTFQGTGMDEGMMRKNTQAIESAKRKGEVLNFVPTWQQFIDACEARFHWYNTQHQHSSLGRKAPAEMYRANFDESWACPLTEDETINLYRPFVTRTPARGEIRWLNNIYFHQSLVELPTNTKVRMAYDMSDASKVWVSDLNGRFICEAEFEGNKRAGFAVSLKDSLKEKRIDNKIKKAEEKIALAEMERGNTFDGESRNVIEFDLPEPVPEKQTLDDLLEPGPVERKKLTSQETWMFLYEQQNQEDENIPNTKLASL
jgi:putative transposase